MIGDFRCDPQPDAPILLFFNPSIFLPTPYIHSSFPTPFTHPLIHSFTHFLLQPFNLSPSFPHRHCDLRICRPVIEEPLVFIENKSFKKTNIVHLAGDFIGFGGFEEIGVGAVENFEGIGGIEEDLSGSVGACRKRGVTFLGTIPRIIDEQYAVFGQHCRGTRLDKVAVEHPFTRREYGLKRFLIGCDHWRPIDQVVRGSGKNVRVAEVHPIFAPDARGHLLAANQPGHD